MVANLPVIRLQCSFVQMRRRASSKVSVGLPTVMLVGMSHQATFPRARIV